MIFKSFGYQGLHVSVLAAFQYLISFGSCDISALTSKLEQFTKKTCMGNIFVYKKKQIYDINAFHVTSKVTNCKSQRTAVPRNNHFWLGTPASTLDTVMAHITD